MIGKIWHNLNQGHIVAATLEKYDSESADVINFLGLGDRKVMTEPRDASECLYITNSYVK